MSILYNGKLPTYKAIVLAIVLKKKTKENFEIVCVIIYTSKRKWRLLLPGFSKAIMVVGVWMKFSVNSLF